MRPIDVIHIFEDVGNVKWDDTFSLALKASSSKFLYDRLMIFRFLGGGAAPFITTETKLCL